MRHHRGDPPLLLPGFLLLDVSRGGPAVPHARGGLWERILPKEVLLRVRLPLPCHCGRRLRSYRLPELRDQEGVSAAFWTNPWKCRVDTPDAPAGLLWLYMAAFEKKSPHHFCPGFTCTPTATETFELLFARDGQLFNFLCRLKVADRLNTVVSRGAVAALMPFCLKTLLWPLVCKCSLKEKSTVRKKAFT